MMVVPAQLRKRFAFLEAAIYFISQLLQITKIQYPNLLSPNLLTFDSHIS